MTAMFQKRHYKAIAETLRNDVPGAYKWTVVHTLADMFAKDNPLFNRKRFYDACKDVKQ
jgi:hypothetical protein